MTHFPSKVQAITIFLRTPSLLRLVNPLVVFISKWQSFKKCSRATQNALDGRMRPAGRSLPTPDLNNLLVLPWKKKENIWMSILDNDLPPYSAMMMKNLNVFSATLFSVQSL